jgi:uncharacterized protein (DUF2141 family)
LAVVGGQSYFDEQTLDGVTADEYGTTNGADTSLFTSASAYQGGFSDDGPGQTPSPVISSASSNLGQSTGGPSGEGGDDAVLLHANGVLDVLGTQQNGYPLLQTVPYPTTGSPGTPIGVVALGDPSVNSGNKSLVAVVTSAGFFYYRWNGSGLTALNTTVQTTLSGADGGSFISPPAGDPAFATTSSSFSYALPAGATMEAVYQQAPNAGATSQGNIPVFALAYGMNGRYEVDLFDYIGNNVDFLDHIEGQYLNNTVSPLTFRFALDPRFGVVPGTAMTDHDGDNQVFMTVWQQGYTISYVLRIGGTTPTYSANALEQPYGTSTVDVTGGGGSDYVPCSTPGATVMPTLADDTFLPGSTPASASGSFNAQVCAWRSGADTVDYQTEFLSLTQDNGPQSGSKIPALAQYTGGDQAPGDPYDPTAAPISAAISFPCAEVLGPLSQNTSPDQVDTASASTNFCSGGSTLTPDNAFDPTTPTYTVRITGIECAPGCATGDPTYLQQHDASYQWQYNEPTTFSSTVTQLPTTVGQSPDFAMVPLDPSPVTWTGQLLVDSAGTAAYSQPATSNPVPTAVMVAPPYYNGGQQQVTPTETTFDNSTCTSSSSDYSNSVSLSGGLDADFGPLPIEVEATAGLEAEFSKETEINNCNEIDQSFIDSNFSNDFVASNSVLFRVDTGTDTYADLTSNTLGVGLTKGCSLDDTAACNPIFVPSGSQYVLQSLQQIQSPQPNNVYAADDTFLNDNFGQALANAFPQSGNPASYGSVSGGTYPGCPSNSPPSTEVGSGNASINDSDYPNPFAQPAANSAPDVLAGPVAEVDPASDGEEGGTSSTLKDDESTTQTSSTQITGSVELSVKFFDFRGTVEYQHGVGASSSAEFEQGTEFTGGVDDYTGFFNPYSYGLYECATSLPSQSLTYGDIDNTAASVPIFLISYTANLTPDGEPLNFVAPNNPSGTVHQPYSGQVFASGGDPGYSYAVMSGSTPPGVSLGSTDGQLAGTPTAAGTYTFGVRATDQQGNTALQDVTITINPALSLDNPLAGGDLGQAYSQPLNVQGGVGPYTYLLTNAPNTNGLPPGLGIDNSTGTIEGTPTKRGTYCFAVYVADSNFPQATATLPSCITINASLAPLTLTTSSANAEVGVPFSVTLSGASGGTEPYIWSTDPLNPLPAGLSLNAATGVISGTPSVAETYQNSIFENGMIGDYPDVTVTDAAGASSTSSLVITIAPRLSFATPSLPDTLVGASYSGSVGASGGVTPYSFTISKLPGNPSGLPPGLSLNSSSGAITGSTTIAGTYDFQVDVKDAFGTTATENVAINVGSPGSATAPAITSSGGETVAVGAARSFIVDTTGSPTPLLSEAGALPVGFSFTANSNGTATITGTPVIAGSTTITLSAANGVSPDASQVFTFTIGRPPSITTQPTDQTAVAGTSATFTAAASGSSPLSVQWEVSADGTDWSNVPDATSTTLTLNAVPLSLNGLQYEAFFSGPFGAATTSAATLTVTSPPVVTLQPTDQSVTAGATATFSAAATGQPSPSVQWAESDDGGTDWVAISNATSSTLTLSSVPLRDNGDLYEAVFTNTYGIVATSPAVLTVLSTVTPAAPVITSQPNDQTAVAGTQAVFSSTASGSPAPSVQWQVSVDNGTEWSPISGATSSTLTLNDVGSLDDGNLYQAVFTNGSGAVTSNRAELVVQTAPTVTTQPVSQTVASGGIVTFTAAASGNPSPSVVWEVSAGGGAFTLISGATSTTLTLTANALLNGDVYEAFFSNGVGTATSQPAALTVPTTPTPVAPVLTTQPNDQTVTNGGSATFTAAASGTPAPTVQWQVSVDNGTEWTPITAATSTTLTLNGASTKDDGNLYEAVFTNSAGSATSHQAALTVLVPPTITTQPTSQTTTSGGSVTFTAPVSGDPAPTVQWEVSTDGGPYVPISGATSPTLTVTATSAMNGDSYEAVVTNSAGSVTSTPVSLTVTPTSTGSGTSGSTTPVTGATSHGYWLVGSDGGIFSFGAAQFYGSTGNLKLNRPVVGITPTADKGGYWLVASDGGIFSFGDTKFYGSLPGLGLSPAGTKAAHRLNAPIVGAVPSADGLGYFMVAADGGVFAFGDAKFEGSCPSTPGGCDGIAVSVAPDASGNGYWLATSSGNVYTFGDASFYGAPGPQSSAITSLTRTPDGKGYWILDANGQVFSYGDAAALGSLPADSAGGLDPAVAVVATSTGNGYWVASALGKVFDFGDAASDGDESSTHLNGAIIAAAGY